jgi:riboflavin kinase/FMN adenylyltransferase
MDLVRGRHNLRSRHRGCVLTIGNYDGVHLGHQHMLGELRRAARQQDLPATVLTFEPTPLEYFAGDEAPARLTRLREKLGALELYGVERLLILRFDRKMQTVSASSFINDLLVAQLGVREIIVGHDFRFARAREGNVGTLREAGARHAFSVTEVEPFELGGERVSSTLVREALGRGDLARATRLLGRPYRMAGRVRRGRMLGRELGFPTANLALHRRVVPLWGIFAVRVSGPGFAGQPGVASLGTRPTVSSGEPLLEVHLFDFAGDLYGAHLDVDFLARLRSEQRFESLERLVEQMHLDAAAARAILFDSP